MNTYNFPDFTLKYENINATTFENLPDYYGIVFKFGDDRFEIIHNLLMGYRLIMNNLINYSCKEVPFKQETAGFLPDGIEVIWKI